MSEDTTKNNDLSWWEYPLKAVIDGIAGEGSYKSISGLTNLFNSESSSSGSSDTLERAKSAGLGAAIGAALAGLSKLLKHLPGIGFIFKPLSNLKVSTAVGTLLGAIFGGSDNEGTSQSNDSSPPSLNSHFTDAATQYVVEQTGIDETMVKEIAASFESVVGHAQDALSTAEDKISDFAQSFADKHSGEVTVESVEQVCRSYLGFEPS